MSIRPYELQQMQALPLELKILKTRRRIDEWYNHFNGEVSISFSGGIDSTVLLDIVRERYPNIEAIFFDTGLEYPELKKFVKSFPNVRILKPKIGFKEVLETYGYPVVSKRISRFIRDVKDTKGNNLNVVNLRLTGYNQNGVYCPSMIIPKKWMFLLNAPFKISEKCCDVMKKEPAKRYLKESNKVTMTGEMADDSLFRYRSYLARGCNGFTGEVKSTPLGFWKQQDVLEYLYTRELPYAEVYGEVKFINGSYCLTGEKHTGCMFCMFGIHMEKGENRFQRMQYTHPKHYNFCMDVLKIDKVLDYLSIPY